MYFFFFNDTATTEIYTLSLHDALPISYFTLGKGFGTFIRRSRQTLVFVGYDSRATSMEFATAFTQGDRKSTRLNSSHANISYAVFCLKKKTTIHIPANTYKSQFNIYVL